MQDLFRPFVFLVKIFFSYVTNRTMASKIDSLNREISALQKTHDRLAEDVNYSSQPGMKDRIKDLRQRIAKAKEELKTAYSPERQDSDAYKEIWGENKRGR